MLECVERALLILCVCIGLLIGPRTPYCLSRPSNLGEEALASLLSHVIHLTVVWAWIFLFFAYESIRVYRFALLSMIWHPLGMPDLIIFQCGGINLEVALVSRGKMEAQGLAHTLSFLYLDMLQRVIMIFLLVCFSPIGTLIVVRNPASPQLNHLVVKNVQVELQLDVSHEYERFYLPLHFRHLLGDDQLLVDRQLGLAIDAG